MCQHRRAYHLDLDICARREKNLPPDREPVHGSSTVDGVSHDRIDGPQGCKGNYKVVAAAVLSVLAALLSNYYTSLATFTDPGLMIKQLPLLILLVIVNLYVLFQIPHLTLSIFSGSTGGHGGSMLTAATALLLRS